jgi:CDP-glucose 4,6-dehydratase
VEDLVIERFYAGRSVLVTGHTGFKGAWLCHWLRRMGARVTGLALPPEGDPSLFRLAHLETRMRSTIGDVRDPRALAEAFRADPPDVVFHLAAQPLVRRSYDEPVLTLETNVMGTAHLLEAVRSTGKPCAAVMVTSDKCYENREQLYGYREDEPMGGHDVYSMSKGASELVIASWRRSFFPTAQLSEARRRRGLRPRGQRHRRRRPGRRQDHPRLRARLVEDGPAHAEAWNFGPREGESIPAGEIAKRLVAILGRGTLEIAEVDPNAPHEAAALRLECSKARAKLGFRPRLEVDEALRMTAEWYRAVLDDPEAAAPMLDRQIDHYLSHPG